jgi:hypothetical protein
VDKLAPELREKFLRFREVYEHNRIKLEESGASGKVVAAEVWKAALAEVPLADEELHIYKMHVALHSVNGGDLFGE